MLAHFEQKATQHAVCKGLKINTLSSSLARASSQMYCHVTGLSLILIFKGKEKTSALCSYLFLKPQTISLTVQLYVQNMMY